MQGNEPKWVKNFVGAHQLGSIIFVSLALQGCWSFIKIKVLVGYCVGKTWALSQLKLLGISLIAVALFLGLISSAFLGVTRLIVVSELKSLGFSGPSPEHALLSLLSICQHFNVFLKFSISLDGFQELVKRLLKVAKNILVEIGLRGNLIKFFGLKVF